MLEERINLLNFFAKRIVEIGLLSGGEVNLLGQVVNCVDDKGSGWVELVYASAFGQNWMEIGVDIAGILTDFDSFIAFEGYIMKILLCFSISASPSST